MRPPGAPGPARAQVTLAWGSYGTEPDASVSALESTAIEAALARFGSGPGRPRPSPALVLAARELARGAAAQETDPIAPARVRAALAHALAFDPAPIVHLVAADVAAAPSALAAGLSSPAGISHLGVGAEVRGDRAYLVLLLVRRKVALEPFPREVAPGAELPLRGELVGLAAPEVHVTSPSGASSTVPLQRRSARGFTASVRFQRPGRWVVEVEGTGVRGPEVAALLVVSCGGASLDPPRTALDPPDPADGRQAEEQVIEAVNAARRTEGLPALTPWPALSEVARRHSRAMLAAGEVAHRLPGSENAGDRLRQARVPYALVLENVARGPSALAAHRLIEESPAHRQNLLARTATRIGCGIARGTLAGGEQVVYLTELLVEPVEDGRSDWLSPEARVREAIWRERQRLGAPALLSDPSLDELARGAAREMLRSGRPDAERFAERAIQAGRRIAAADGFVAARASDATRSRNLPDRRFRRVGVGVAVGDSPRFGAGLLWIVVVYSD